MYGNGVLTYIARYLRGGPISNKRIISFKDGEVTFNYVREKRALMTLPIDRFIGRFLQHVPQPRAVYIRSYGLYHSGRKEDLSFCRKMMGQPPIKEPESLDWQTYCAEHGNDHPEVCPICGKRLVVSRLLSPLTASEYSENPPVLQAFYDAAG
ncbi:MAG: transposase [Thermodesulfobacteriota bacterium]|nr:transposase [Thermodesulfobacteriota bacterium]